MRGDLDMVEEVRIKKTNKILNKYLPYKVIAFLVFLIFCGLFFNSSFLLSTEVVNKIDKRMEELNKESKTSSRRTYYIEQKIREQVEKLNQDKK